MDVGFRASRSGMERINSCCCHGAFLFALGICGSFVVVNNLLCLLEKKHLLRLGFSIDQKYLVPTLRDTYAAKTYTT